jgi:hypothetical protein
MWFSTSLRVLLLYCIICSMRKVQILVFLVDVVFFQISSCFQVVIYLFEYSIQFTQGRKQRTKRRKLSTTSPSLRSTGVNLYHMHRTKEKECHLLYKSSSSEAKGK